MSGVVVVARDALDPGPAGNYPNWPRLPDGTPDPDRMPTGVTRQRVRGGSVRVDVTPTDPQGRPIVPPTIPPAGGQETT